MCQALEFCPYIDEPLEKHYDVEERNKDSYYHNWGKDRSHDQYYDCGDECGQEETQNEGDLKIQLRNIINTPIQDHP